MYVLKRDENGEWRRLHNEELHCLYRSPNIFRAIKSRRLRWAGHVAGMEEGRSAFKILTGSLKIYKTIILPVGLYGCETWSLTLREECRLRVFENRILGPRGMRMGSGEGYTTRNFIVCSIHLI